MDKWGIGRLERCPPDRIHSGRERWMDGWMDGWMDWKIARLPDSFGQGKME
jgi:hypothetical protein